MTEMNFTDNQNAFDYALYMIAGSYFRKASCRNKNMERKLLLYYREQKEKDQYLMEDICIRFMDELEKQLPSKVFQQDMDVYLIRRKAGNPIEVLFVGKELLFCFFGIYEGKKTKISFEAWRKRRKNKM